ncbi:hypothetical protein [Dyadobacter tibetensis]|uniref:hypothetical protein n=1 Tax=Dyadobacter tibetensis TaxID=1211851 RepID=UPI0004729950|nr:hypothetical protein [Dyadobacter tibetensis]
MNALFTDNLFQWTSVTEIIFPLLLSAVIGYALSRLFLSVKSNRIKNSIANLRSEISKLQKDSSIQGRQKDRLSTVSTRKTVYPKPETEQSKSDDFKIIEGIGPKIEELLKKEGILTYGDLANTSPIRLASILRNAGPRFQIQDPSSWPKQANLAKFGKWIELQNLKEHLMGGKEPPIN